MRYLMAKSTLPPTRLQYIQHLLTLELLTDLGHRGQVSMLRLSQPVIVVLGNNCIQVT